MSTAMTSISTNREGVLANGKEDRTPITQTEEDRRIADINWNRYTRARDNGHVEFMEDAKMFDRFYRGEQWSEKDLTKLELSNRPALTINTILPTVNTVLGEQATKRSEVTFKPKRGSSDETAHIMSRLFRQISDTNSYDWTESQVFADGLIQDRGFFDVRMDFAKNMQGEIKISQEENLNIILDPDAKSYDPATWYEVFKTKWVSLDDIENVFGAKKADLIRNYVDQGQYYGSDSVQVNENRFGPYNIYPTTHQTAMSGVLPEEEIRMIRNVRIIERQYRILSSVEYFIDSNTGDMKQCPETWDEKRRYDFAAKHRMKVVSRDVKRIRWTVSVDQVLLHDSWSPYSEFTIIPYFPYFRRGRPFGMVRNLISPQEQLNKVSSQELHVVNTTANSGWKVPTGSLINMTLDELQDRGAETGIVIEYNPSVAPEGPIRIEPNNVPAGLDRISMKAASNIKEISGVSNAMLGFDTPEISGAAIQAKQARGQVQMQVPLDNLTFTRRLVADRVLRLVQQFYTEERVYFVSNDSFGIEPGAKEYEEIMINQQKASGEIVNNVTVGDYEIKVSSSPAKDVFSETQFEEAMQMRSVGIQIPDDVVVRMSNLINKDQVSERILKATGQSEPTPEEIEQQQQMQQIQMRAMELEMGKLEAEIEKMNTESAGNLAGVEYDQQKLMVETQLEIMKLKLQQQQLQINAVTSQQTTAIKSMADLKRTEMDNETRLITSQIRARNDAKNKAKTPTRK